MVPQLYRVACEYGVPVASSGGFDSVTAKHDAAQRFQWYGLPVVVLHIGDYDPSGCAIVDSVAEDIAAFGADVEFRRLAVVPEQIGFLRLPTAPAKATDRRGGAMGATVQAEAIAPSDLEQLLRAAIEANLDMDVRADLLEVEARERAEVIAHAGEVA